MSRDRFITLSDTILDREKVTAVYRDNTVDGRINVLYDNGQIHWFEGSDAIELWRQFSDEKTWRDE